MHRGRILARLHLIAIAAVLPSMASVALALGPPEAAGKRPNIVLILADDLGYGDLACYNSASKIPTPRLDRLAREGMRFTDAHAPTAVCTPTRYAILTGRYSWRTRLKRGVLPPWGTPLIASERLTVAKMLQQQGYATACLGKWHLGFQWPTKDAKPPRSGASNPLSNVDFSKPIAQGPTTRGFDSYFGVDLPNYPPYCFIDGDRTVGIPAVKNGPAMNRPGQMLPGWKQVEILPELKRRAKEFIATAAADPQKPFFLYFALTAPHYPIVPAPEYHNKSHAGDYGDFVVQVDDTVGAVLDALRASGAEKNTLVIFTSDNGPEVTGEVKVGVYDRILQYNHASMGELRGAKRDSWEGGHRVPFIARWPGQIPAAASSETICLVDFMATVAAIVGARIPSDAAEDSYNILPVLKGEKLDHALREATVLHSGSGHFALRQGPWVLIDWPTGDNNHEPQWFKERRGYQAHHEAGELYDLRQDISQRRNLYAEKPDVVKRLKELLEKYQRDGRSTPGPAQKNDVADIGSGDDAGICWTE
jgi:arylsulfatase A